MNKIAQYNNELKPINNFAKTCIIYSSITNTSGICFFM